MELASGGAVILRHWRTVIAVALIGALVALGATYVLPQKYQASTSLLVHARDVHLFSSQGQPASGAVDYGQTTALVKTIDDTQGAVLTSRPVAERVVQQLHLDLPRPPQNWFAAFKQEVRKLISVTVAYVKYGFYQESPPYEAAVAAVQSSLSATQVQDSYVLQVKANASTPEDAANIANAASNAFITYSKDIYGNEAKTHSTFVGSELKKAQDTVNQSQDNLTAYKQAHNLPQVTSQVQLDLTTVDTAQKTLQSNDAQLAAVQARLDSLRNQVKNTSTTVQQTQEQQGNTVAHSQGGNQQVSQTGNVHNTGGNTVSSQNETVVADGQGTTHTAPLTAAPTPAAGSTTPPAAAAGRFGASDGSSDQKTTTTSNNVQRSTIAPSYTTTTTTQNIVTNPSDTTQQTAQSQSTTMPNPVYQQLVIAQAQAEQDVAALQSMHNVLAAALDHAKTTLSSYPTAESQLVLLQLQLDAATSTYLKLRSEYEDALITEAQSVNDVSIVDVATPPIYPSRPLKFLYFLIGLAVGAIGGTGVGFWQAHWSRTHAAGRQRREAVRRAPNLGGALPDAGGGAAFSSDGGAA